MHGEGKNIIWRNAYCMAWQRNIYSGYCYKKNGQVKEYKFGGYILLYLNCGRIILQAHVLDSWSISS
jgi:hypothetical protein